ncbi:Adenine deaminase [Aphis craccivora]|uniref:Adenine deaminase n=1 Tax=Aphis craccivora TaxID=307492 RepID=A0A6G0VV34_APHCR|nr:Adenine deaminase [Aphis craccivora]
MFMNLIPKGGDLHNHLSGALFFEDYVNIFNKLNYCIDNRTFQVSKNYSNNCKSFKELDINTYNEMRKRWSILDYKYNYGNLEKFFDIFNYLRLPLDCVKEALLIVKSRAINENIQYIEFMLGMRSIINVDDSKNITFDFNNINILMKMFDNDSVKQSNIYQAIKIINNFNISDNNFTVKYLISLSRTLNPYLFFEQIYYASKIYNKTEEVVGVNVSDREDNKYSFIYYDIQIEIIKYFKDLFNLKVSLHSGELTRKITKPENLNHIHSSINVAHRIGHGVDIMFEPDPINIMKTMRDKKIAVEINLSSNEFLLGIKPIDNPITLYMKNGVPVVLSSDDPGIFMTTLSEQYYLLMKNFNLTFSELKDVIYNGIHYSFLNEKDKKEQLIILDKKFIEFEYKLSNYRI